MLSSREWSVRTELKLAGWLTVSYTAAVFALGAGALAGIRWRRNGERFRRAVGLDRQPVEPWLAPEPKVRASVRDRVRPEPIFRESRWLYHERGFKNGLLLRTNPRPEQS